MDSSVKTTRRKEKTLVALPPIMNDICHRKQQTKRIVHPLPCIRFGSTRYIIAAPHAVRKFGKCSRKVQNFRFGKPTIGEIHFTNKHKDLNNMDPAREKTRNSESLLLICQKIEHIKNLQKNEKWRIEKPTPFRFNIPAFPAREEFVFRNRHGNQLTSKFPRHPKNFFQKGMNSKNEM